MPNIGPNDSKLMDLQALKRKSFLLPLALFVLFTVSVCVLLSTGAVKHDSLVRTLTQWDGQHYLSIARDGYVKFPCQSNPQEICGNTGWFPLYPMLGWLLSQVGIPVGYAMIVVSWLALLAALLLLYRLLKRKFDRRTAITSLVALLLFPSSFYYLTVFPYSLSLLLAVITFDLMERHKYTFLWLPVALLTVAYPSGVVIGLPIAWILFRDWRTLDSKDRLALCASLAAIGLALVAYFAYYWIVFDDFWLYVHFQAKSYYSHKPTVPLIPIVNSLITLPYYHPVFISLVFGLVGAMLFITRRIGAPWLIYLFAILLFTPTMGTTDCYYRHITMAFPFSVMVGLAMQTRRRVLAIAWLLLSAFLAVAFYLRWYKIGVLM